MEMSELLESVGEWESESEAAEGRGRGAPRRPSNQPSFKQRPPPGAPAYVTQTQLEAALTRSDAKIKTVADGVSTINARLVALSAAAKKEADERKKSLDAQSRDLNQKLQLMAMLPLLVTPTTAGPVMDTNGNVINQVVVPDSNSLDQLLPLLLVTGIGGTGGGFGMGGDSSDSSSMMMLALVLAMAK